MPTLHIEGYGSHSVEAGTRLVLAIESAGVDILHRCGGHARCTTCRVSFSAGEPKQMTRAEHDKLGEKGDLGSYRLSCQCLVDEDMHVEALMTLSNTDLDDAGDTPEVGITPDPDWIEAPQG